MKKLFISFLIFPSLVYADAYKCVDGGKTSYSSVPCSSGSKASVLSFGSSGSFSVTRGRNGLYKVPAFVNGVALEMVLDTGASFTTVDGNVAASLGIKSCAVAGVVNTGNGQAAICAVNVNNIRFGAFSFSNVPLKIQPAMTVQGVIGSDLLSQFRIEQNAGVMTLSR